MRRNVIYLMAYTTAMILVVSCVSTSKGGTAQGTVPELVLMHAENQAEDYPTTQGTYKFVELAYEKTGGRMKIQVNASGVSGNEGTMIEQLQPGGVDSAGASLSPLIEPVPKLNVPQVPYLYMGREHVWRALEGPTGTDFAGSFGGSSLVPLSWYNAGIHNFYGMDRSIESLDDMEGLKVRVQESELMMDTIQILGATPVFMALGSVYSGLQTEEIDGIENNWPPYESTKHYETAQYLTLDEHTRVPKPQLAAQSTWDKLSEEYGNTTWDRVWESALYEHGPWAGCERISEGRIRGAGCVATELDVREKERFRGATASMYEKYCSEYVDITNDAMDTGRQ